MCINRNEIINAWNNDNEIFDNEIGKIKELSIYSQNVIILCDNKKDKTKNYNFDRKF